jgi:hypothetical protein
MGNDIQKTDDNERKLFSVNSGFEWTDERVVAAKMLATGHTVKETAQEIGVSERTIYNWKATEEFDQEIDRLSVIIGVASKAHRMRILNRMIRSFIKQNGDVELHDESLLDLLKEARMQSEGTRIDITSLYTALSQEARSVARSGPDRTPELSEEESDSTK